MHTYIRTDDGWKADVRTEEIIYRSRLALKNKCTLESYLCVSERMVEQTSVRGKFFLANGTLVHQPYPMGSPVDAKVVVNTKQPTAYITFVPEKQMYYELFD